MKYLGIDYGKKKIGLAVSLGQIASILDVVKINGLADAVSKVSRVIDKEEINRVVVGLPESGQALQITQKFIKALKAKFKLKPVEIIQTAETLSSYQARNMMVELKLGQADIQKKEDEYAASIILQNFLDSLQ